MTPLSVEDVIGRPPQCPDCRGSAFACVDTPDIRGGWDNTLIIRCVECKFTFANPASQSLASLLQSERERGERYREALGPFAKIATPKYPGERHTSPLYGLERQTGTGELRLYSPFSDSREELPMFSADFERALAALQPESSS